VRLDSGDLLTLSRRVRDVLDEAGLTEVTIFASGNLDEHEIDRLLGAGAPIDGFGVGSRLVVSADAPYIDLVYKLVAFDGRPVLKLSSGKATLPGPKQVWRRIERGLFAGDVVELSTSRGSGGGGAARAGDEGRRASPRRFAGRGPQPRGGTTGGTPPSRDALTPACIPVEIGTGLDAIRRATTAEAGR
jgi:nicotinate phosphoribosyltransferase